MIPNGDQSRQVRGGGWTRRILWTLFLLTLLALAASLDWFS